MWTGWFRVFFGIPLDSAFVQACQSTQRDFDTDLFSPFAVVAGDGSARLWLVAGETLICDWYNVPVPDGQD